MIEPPCAVAKVPTEPAATLSVSPSRSVSFDCSATLPTSTVSSAVLAASSIATGASFTALTVIVRRPTSVAVPSLTV